MMNKNFFMYMLLPLTLFSCGGQNYSGVEFETDAPGQEQQTDVSAAENGDIIAVEMDSTVIPVSTFGVEYHSDPRFGLNNYEIPMPQIKGLYTSDRWAFCQKDSCHTGFYVVGIRCPKSLGVRRWVNNMLWEVMKKEGFDKKAPEGMVNNLEVPNSEVTDFYLNQWKDHYHHYLNDTLECEKSGRFAFPTEQFGLIIADVWQNEGYCTLCVHSWYDMLSNGCPYATSYYTLNASTGKEMMVDDIILKTDFPKVEKLLKGKIAWMKKQSGTQLEDINYLENSSGVALIKEGLLVYYYSYKIGFGFEGQINVIIPYSQLEKEGVPLKIL